MISVLKIFFFSGLGGFVLELTSQYRQVKEKIGGGVQSVVSEDERCVNIYC